MTRFKRALPSFESTISPFLFAYVVCLIQFLFLFVRSCRVLAVLKKGKRKQIMIRFFFSRNIQATEIEFMQRAPGRSPLRLLEAVSPPSPPSPRTSPPQPPPPPQETPQPLFNGQSSLAAKRRRPDVNCACSSAYCAHVK